MQRPIHALLLHNSAVTVQTSCTACSSDRHTFRSCVVAYRTKHCRVRTRSLFNTSLSLGYVRCTCQEPLLFLQCDYNMFDGDNMLERFKHRVQSAECRVQSAECRVQSALWSTQKHTWLCGFRILTTASTLDCVYVRV